MQIRHSRDLEGRARAAPSPMTVDELFARFPEVPRDLRDEPVLAEFVRAFGSQLRVAQKPSPCVAQAGARDAQHHFFTRLGNDLALFRIRLAPRERTLHRRLTLRPEVPAAPAHLTSPPVPEQPPETPR